MVHAFERILIVMMENQYRNYVLTDPFMAKLAEAGLSLTNSFGCFHPSQTNYVASLAGELCNVTNDTAPTTALTQPTLVDRMEAKGVSWKAYMEALPQEPWTKVWQAPSYPADEAPIAEYPNTNDALARYFRKHNAFASFQSIQSQQERWEKIVDEHQFWADVGNEALPQYAWFTPDIWNDGHYLYNTHIDTNPRTQLVPQMSAWLEYVFLGDTDASKIQGAAKAGVANIGLNLDVDLLLTDPAAAWAASRVPKGTLIVITFDEADYDAVGYDTNYDGPNQIYTVMLGDMITPGSTWDRPFNHYSLIRTVEENFALDSLNTNDKGAGWLRGLWGKSYGWSHPQEASCLTLGATSEAACAGGAACLVTDAKDGALQMARMTCEGWSAPAPLDLPETNGVFRLTAFDDGLMLVMQQADGGYTAAVSKDGVAWSDPAPLPAAIKGANPALLGYRDTGDNETPKAMLCWQDAQGFIHSAVFDGTAWQDPQPVGQLSDGSMALGQLGPSLFLVYKERNTQAMRVTSYNLATFNVLTAQTFDDQPAPENNTTQYAWSIADYPVGNFAKKLAALKHEYLADGKLTLATIEGEMHLVHRAAYADTPHAYDTVFGLTGILTAATAGSNGFGTLDQAGWTREATVPGVKLPAGGAHALTADGQGGLVLIWADADTGTPYWSRAGYDP